MSRPPSLHAIRSARLPKRTLRQTCKLVAALPDNVKHVVGRHLLKRLINAPPWRHGRIIRSVRADYS